MQDTTDTVFQMRFPQKLWYLLHLHTDAILWGGTGRTILLNYRILHSYLRCDNSIFKTTNISSFIRQLNLYGFRKVTSHLQDPLCNSSNPFMHEYVHDYFQYGRPELLKKITRKALTMKRNIKTKNILTIDQNLYTPLQKARHALRVALNKVAEDHFLNNAEELKYDMEYEDAANEPCEDEIELNWILAKTDSNKESYPKTDLGNDKKPIEQEPSVNAGATSQENVTSYTADTCQQGLETFQAQLLSMPDLDTISDHNECGGVELLAEFNVCRNACEDTMKQKENVNNSLNCVLPSVGTYNMDDGPINEKNSQYHYHGEWDQMFNDIMTNKSSHQDGSNLKDLYSQISMATDLLNP